MTFVELPVVPLYWHFPEQLRDRGELSFLSPVQFCICLRDSAILTGYLFQQGPACMHVPNWKKCPASE